MTSIEWLESKLDIILPLDFEWDRLGKAFEQAKEMEKQQMDKVAGDWWNEGASYMYDGKRKYETFEQYYNETYKK
jgi:hypothetical protein